MKNLYYSVIGLGVMVYYGFGKLINTLLGTNIGLYGKFNDMELDFDEYEKKLITFDIFKALINVYFDIHHVVLNGITNEKDYIVPDFWLLLAYPVLLNKLKAYQQLEQFKTLPPFSFDDFASLEVNVEGMIKEYPRKRKKTLEYMARLDKLFREVCKTDNFLPENIQEYIDDYYELIKEHKKKRNKNKQEYKSKYISFTVRNSDKKRLFIFLELNINMWFDLNEISSTAKVKVKDIYGIIHQLKEDLKRNGNDKKVRIENKKRNGEYRLKQIAS